MELSEFNNHYLSNLDNLSEENKTVVSTDLVSIRFNLQPSLTKRRLELLQYVKEKLVAVKEMKFPYADMHGNLKVVLNTPIRNRYVVGFKTKEDVGQILASLGTDNYEGISYAEY